MRSNTLPTQVTEALERLAKRHPAITHLATRYLRMGYPDRHYFEELERMPANSRIPGALQSAVFAAPRVIPHISAALASYRLRTWVSFLQHHHKKPLAPLDGMTMRREDIPQCIGRFAGLYRPSPQKVLQALVVIPAYRAENKLPAFPSKSCRILSEAQPEILADAYMAFFLTPMLAKRYLNEPITLNHCQFYFDTGVPLLNLRNTLVFTDTFLTQDAQGGRLQNKIPHIVSKILGINRLSIPELRLTADLIGMAANGIVVPKKLPNKPLASTLKMVIENYAWHDLGLLARNLTVHTLMTPTLAKRAFEADSRRWLSLYWTGQAFNTERLITGAENRPLFSHFYGYYQAIDRKKLDTYIRISSKSLSKKKAAALLRACHLLHDPSRESIRDRDIYNCLHYVMVHSRHEPTSLLPPVALYAMGLHEPVIRRIHTRQYIPRTSASGERRQYPLSAVPDLARAMPLLR